MCGIVGYIGQHNVQQILLNGLEKLEYRGYDSSGIYIVNQKQDRLYKSIGSIEQLKKSVDFSMSATYGIGHTRWATHGVPSLENAHPHQSHSKRFTLVHNGVIENYTVLKQHYLADIELNGQTDSEIVVNLMDYFTINEQLSTKEAFKKIISLLHGSYAFVLIDKQTPDTLFVAKNKSPLLIGTGQNFNVICSDALAAIQLTNQFIELHDKDFVTVTKDQLIIENNDNLVIRQPFIASIDATDLEKGTYPYYMLKEIDEQPTVIRKIIQSYQTNNNNLSVDPHIKQAILNSDRIHIIACGTSYHAGLIGKYYLEQLAKIPTEVHIASEFAYSTPLITGNPLFIFISQSGETADSRQALVKVKSLGYKSLTITNVKGSTLSRESDFTLLLHAGPEIAVASTKAYTAQIALLALLANDLSQTPLQMEKELSIVASNMETIIDNKYLIHDIAKKYLKNKKSAFFIGRSLDYFVSLEAALKLKEISYIQTEGFASGELKHGTIALIEKDTPVFAMITSKSTHNHTRSNIQEVKARGALTCTFVLENLATKEDQFILPNINELFSPLLAIIPTQLLAYYATLELGYDIDKPRNLAKSVTVE